MIDQDLSRRALLKGGGAALAGLGALRVSGPAHAFPGEPGEEVIPWFDQPPPAPYPNPLEWEKLSYHTPADDFFVVSHFQADPIPDPAAWRLGIDGLVRRPQTLSLDDLKARQRGEVTFTLECSGNHGFPFVTGAIGNARWAGTPLAPLLRRAGVRRKASEVVFWGADSAATVIRDNVGVIKQLPTDAPAEGPDMRDLTITEAFAEPFARSMSLEEAMDDRNLLCFEMNGAPLPPEHGRPLRLIAPGWYGVANVKWLTRIEVTDQRFAGRFMARDYVTIRLRGDQTSWTFNTVSHTRLKSAPAKVTRRRNRYSIMGAAWGAPISEVEVQIDGGRWRAARLDRQSSWRDGFAWRLWTLEWGKASPGLHSVRSRAYDADGNRQPAPDDPYLASRVTFWENNGQITRQVKLG